MKNNRNTSHYILLNASEVGIVFATGRLHIERPVHNLPAGCVLSKRHRSGQIANGVAVFVDSESKKMVAEVKSPCGKPGDLVLVRETWAVGREWDRTKPSEIDEHAVVIYRIYGRRTLMTGKWRSSSQMPAWASRITLRTASVAVKKIYGDWVWVFDLENSDDAGI